MHPSQKIGLILLVLIGVVLIASLVKLLDILDMHAVPYVANPTPDILEADLTSAFSSFERGESSRIALSAVTMFSWDRLYVFGPYTPLEHLEAVVGKSWRNICFTRIDVLENDALLVFTHDGNVVHCLEYSIKPYDFSSLGNYESGISSQDAFFFVDDAGNVILADGR